MNVGNSGINSLALVIDGRIKARENKPPVLDFGVIQEDMSLLTNTFPLPIPAGNYLVCRSASYDPKKPLTMSWWYEEGWNKSEWNSGEEQPQNWTEGNWGELVNPETDIPFWDEKHKTPPIDGEDHRHGCKGEHDHGEDGDGKHYHNIYLPRKMYCIQPFDRVLVAWVGEDAVVVDVLGVVS